MVFIFLGNAFSLGWMSVSIKDASFDEAIRAIAGTSEMALIFFAEADCPHCAEAERALLGSSGGSLSVFKVDISQNRDAFQRCLFTGVPAFLILRGTENLGRLEGFPGPEPFFNLVRRLGQRRNLDLSPTPVDTALELARRDADRVNDFLDAFLNSDLFVPVRLLEHPEGNWKAVTPNERFQPLFIRQGERRIVPVFDRLERLQEWAADRTFDYLCLRAHLFLRILASPVAVVLNPGRVTSYLFSPEILDQLRLGAKPVSVS